MQPYKDRRWSNIYAPYGTCPMCGWSGKDWGFKYHNFCRRCYKQWRKDKAEEDRKYKLPITNVKIADRIIVTEHVHNRLRRRAEREVGATPCYWLARISPVIAVLSTMYLIDIVKQNSDSDAIGFGIMFGGIFLAVASYCIFQSFWAWKVATKMIQLANVRQQDLDEQRRFYNSPEWKNLRAEVLSERSPVCQSCGRKIEEANDLTVDHIKPRSKFPEFALDKSNLQVLCRRCNSAKGATYDKSSMTPESTAKIFTGKIERG